MISSLFSPELEQRLLADYQSRMCHFPSVKAQTDAFLREISDRDHRLSLLCMYAYMPEGDVITYPPALIDTFVVSSLRTRQLIPYTANVDPIDFLTYVMHYRVNNENIEEHRDLFFEKLYPRVKGMSIARAALEVNYWCFEKATYCQSDGRTASPLTMIRRTKGRCGEESTLCVSALRSVGIPARQVYVPWWAHTEGNHAWAEFQTEDGVWHFLGACEPEPVMDRGWFTVPGSRSMNMVARAYTKLLKGDDVLDVSPISQFVNCTSRYTPTKRLTVRVTRKGCPAPGLSVAFSVANWHRLAPIFHGKTDANGILSLETGIGCLVVSVSDGVCLCERLADLSERTELEIDISQAVDWNRPQEDQTVRFVLTPPPAILDSNEPLAEPLQQEHEKRLLACKAIRMAYEAEFQTKETFLKKHPDVLSPSEAEALLASKRDYLAESRGNYPVLEAFLLHPDFTMEEKLLLLDSMNEKDLVDTPLSTLLHTLQEALPFRGSVPETIFQSDILSPRIAFAMIEDNRSVFRTFLSDQQVAPRPDAIWNFLTHYVTILPKEQSASRHLGSPLGALTHRVCDERTFDLLFVSLCRAVGIAARMERGGEIHYYEDGRFVCPRDRNPIAAPARSAHDTNRSPSDCQAHRAEEETDCPHFPVSISGNGDRPLHFFRDFLLEKYENGAFGFARLSPHEFEKSGVVSLPRGGYRLIRVRREEDSSAVMALHYFYVDRARSVTLPDLAPAQGHRWVCHPLSDGTLQKLHPLAPDSALPPLRFFTALPDHSSVWMVLRPGEEPTEHLLNEMLAGQEAYQTSAHTFSFLLADGADLSNATLQSVLSALPGIAVYQGDSSFLQQLYEAEPSGDVRFPFLVLADSERQIRYVWSGYRIQTARHVLEVLDAFSRL